MKKVDVPIKRNFNTTRQTNLDCWCRETESREKKWDDEKCKHTYNIWGWGKKSGWWKVESEKSPYKKNPPSMYYGYVWYETKKRSSLHVFIEKRASQKTSLWRCQLNSTSDLKKKSKNNHHSFRFLSLTSIYIKTLYCTFCFCCFSAVSLAS